MDWQILFDTTRDRLDYLLLNKWAAYQIAIIAAGFIFAKLIARILEPYIEERARAIKGNPDLLRIVIAFMRRLHWLFFILWLTGADLLMKEMTWPSRSWMLSKALPLATAWLIVAVLTRVIRNRAFARFVALCTWTYLALNLLGLDAPAVRGLDSVAISLGAMRISLMSVIKGLIITTALVWVAVFLGNVLSHQVDRLDDISPSFRVLLGKFVKIALILLAGMLALSATGIDLTTLTVFSGAVGVGLGFGLQKVVSNFISGIIILMDKSIKPGDTISLGDTFGWIRELRARFVSVITRDGREYLIPNEDFITQQVINWSFSSEYVRIDVDFGVAYTSDPHEVVRIATETAKDIPRVSTYRAPVCWLTAFGASSLDFKLRFWIADPANGLTNVRGQILLALFDAFKDAGIAIPFPHREVIMKTPVEVKLGEQPGQAPGTAATSTASTSATKEGAVAPRKPRTRKPSAKKQP
ncbi:mechanosensitive ion channel family protein [Rhizobium halophytocola]|uniref:Small-conductance mechanosensitive channel n=1 Tax=Rhizobium halophytocola TaxID=735519 RepID=A0ABS4DY08_9HYPH|nr:mechanosensitive ion channel domain-containing protein [Rhizobium halophytocola]MBP1850572.1 small-conductance mechanosensitive channel [Rhizobium halophytocola]